MKNQKQLQAICNKLDKKDYMTFEYFLELIKDFSKDLKKENLIVAMKVSKSGMTRNFSFHKHNGLINAVYHNKLNYGAVKVSGCGMDMLWHLLYTVTQEIFTKKEIEKLGLNSKCSRYNLLTF
jgi:hypothetical protein